MRRSFALAAAPLLLVAVLSACGSSDDDGPAASVPAVGATVNGQQSPNANGNNSGNDQNPSPSDMTGATTTPSNGSTFDTQEKIGDDSP